MRNLKQSVVRVASWEGRVLPGGVRLGPQVAHGGFGVVHRGRLEPSGPDVAVKLLLGARDVERVSGFRAEMSLLAALRHPSIAAIVASGVAEEDGLSRPWMAIEWCEGWTLQAELQRRAGRKHTRAEAWALLGPIVEAVAYAHASGCVHRDLKPANIMMVPDAGAPGGLRPKLIDWGIGKRVAPDARAGTGETATQSHLQAFTEAYAAPEQVAGTRTGPWTDVHALGLLLTELLVGERPYGTGSGIFAILDPTRPTPRTFGVDAGPWEPLLATAMSLQAPQRFRTAAELAGALLEADPAVRGAPGPSAGPLRQAPVVVAAPAPRAAPRARVTAFVALGAGAVALGVGGTLLLLGGGAQPKKRQHDSPPAEPARAASSAAFTATASAPAAPAAAAVRVIASLDALDDPAIIERGKAAQLQFVGVQHKLDEPKMAISTFSFLIGGEPVLLARHRFADMRWFEGIWASMCGPTDARPCARSGSTLLILHGSQKAPQVKLRDALIAGIPGVTRSN